METTNIVITGVGGQGIILVSHILADSAKASGLSVYVGEVHGMAQRGGVVHTYVRIGDIYSSLVPEGEADIVLSLEMGEAYRARNYLNSESWVITNQRRIIPLSVVKGDADYPEAEEIEKALDGLGERTLSVDATKLARESGSEIAENVVMLGIMVATGVLPIEEEMIKEAIVDRVKEEWKEVNLKAFAAGLQKGQDLIADLEL